MDYTAKQTEAVDVGGEVDYGDYQWFSEPPPRREVSNLYKLVGRLKD